MTQVKAATINLRRHILFYMLVSLLALTVALYGYFLNQTIAHGVYVHGNQKELAQLRSDIGILEQEYFETQKSLTLSRAKDLGFSETHEATYLSRAGNRFTLNQ